MQGRHRTSVLVVRVLTLLMMVLLSSLAIASTAAWGRCLSSLVWRATNVERVALRSAVTHEVTLQFLGHSSFLLTSPGGTLILTDPNALFPASASPHAVTVSNEHYTHSNVDSVLPSMKVDALVLRGSGKVSGAASAAVRVGDVLIERLPSNLAGDPKLGMHAGNGIFLFSMGDLCIAHFGNLRQPLSKPQLTALGRVDIALVPIDQWITMGYDIVIDLIAKVQPRWVIPMHYDTPTQPLVFVQFLAANERARHIGHRMVNARSIRVSRRSLPERTEVLILGVPSGER